MSELTPDAEQAIAAMSESEVTDMLARVRSPEEYDDPMARAARALRKSRGLDRRPPASIEQAKENAANAMRNYARGSRS